MTDIIQNWEWPQWTMAGAYFVNLIVTGLTIGTHSQQIKDAHAYTAALAFSLSLYVLLIGGFWS